MDTSAIDLVRYASGLSRWELDQFEPLDTLPQGQRLFDALEARLFEPGECFHASAGMRYALVVVGARARILFIERPDGGCDARRSPATDARSAQAAVDAVRRLVSLPVAA